MVCDLEVVKRNTRLRLGSIRDLDAAEAAQANPATKYYTTS